MTTEKLKNLEPIFGSWYVDSKLAEGKNSKVFKVYKTTEGTTEFLALKTVKFPANDKELSRAIESGKYKTVGEYLDTLEKAVTDNMNKMLALRTNKNIVRFDNFRIVKESSCFYVIMLMELLSPFSDKVKASNITKENIIKISYDLCNAIEGFRSIGIIHHQIKPENIYVDSDGSFKLGDFGISNVAGRIKTEASPYMAPEVYKGAAYDTSSDIYSLGVLLYKLLNNNRLPFLPEYPSPVSLSDRERAFEKQMKGEILPAPAKADPVMAKIISKALAFSQSERFFSPALMKAELDRYSEMTAAEKSVEAPAYNTVTQPPVYIPVAPVPTFTDFRITEDEDEEDQSIYLNPESAVSEAEKNAFRETFKESADDDDDDDDDGKDNKKVYLLVAAIIAVIALIIGVVFLGKSSGSSDRTTGASVALPTVTTTHAPTVATTVPPTVTTSELTTTQATTETTTQTTTAPTTTETTTAPTTTAPTTAAFTDVPELVVSGYSDGDESSDGRIYRSIEDYTVIQTPEDEFFDEVILEISTPLGENVVTQGNVFIYEMSNSAVIQKVLANLEITLTESDGETLICCYITVDDGDFYFSPDYYQYYICFEEGALVSDNAISLPLQLQI